MVAGRKRRGHCWNAMPDICAQLWPNSVPAAWDRNNGRHPRRALRSRSPATLQFAHPHPYMLRCTNQGCFMADAKTLERVHTPASIPQLKPVEQVQKPPHGHWVGDGFPVRTIFAYDDAERTSPFL